MVLLLGVASLPLIAIVVYCLSRSVLLGWISLLALKLYINAFGIGRFDIGSLHLDVVDCFEYCLVAAGVLRIIPRLRERNVARIYILVYLAVYAFSLVRGIIAYGLAHAGNDSRILVGFLIAGLYFSTAPVDSESVRKYVLAFLYFGLGLVAVALLSYLGLDIGGIAMAHLDPDQAATLDGRVLPADSALSLAFCFFFSFAKSHRSKASLIYKCLPVVFLGMAILLRHRTVWTVLIAAVVYFLIKDRAAFLRLLPLVVLSCVVVVGYATIAGHSTQSLEDQFADSATNDSTWQWRLLGWQELLMNEKTTTTNILVGKSLGGGYPRLDPYSKQYIELAPHSEYVTQFYNMGVIGLLMVLCFMIRPLRRFWKLANADVQAVRPSASAWAVVIIGIMVYGVTYNPTVDAYALLGIANAMVIRLDKGTRHGIPAPALAQAG